MKAGTHGMFRRFAKWSRVCLADRSNSGSCKLSDKIVPMPLNNNNFLLGVFNLRGTVIPIVSLKILLNLPEKNENNTEYKVAIVNSEGSRIGYIFDSTSEIIRTKENEVEYVNYENKNSVDVVKGILLNEGHRIVRLLIL